MTIIFQLIGYLLIGFFLGPIGNKFVRAVLKVSGVSSTPPQSTAALSSSSPPPSSPVTLSTPISSIATPIQSSLANQLLPQAAQGSSAAAEKTIKAGRWIGPLERLLLVIGLLASSWDIITAVIALKTVARYKELDTQMTAEYFLIGSLASILWAIVVAWIVHVYDGSIGLHILPYAPSTLDEAPLLHYIRASTGV